MEQGNSIDFHKDFKLALSTVSLVETDVRDDMQDKWGNSLLQEAFNRYAKTDACLSQAGHDISEETFQRLQLKRFKSLRDLSSLLCHYEDKFNVMNKRDT